MASDRFIVWGIDVQDPGRRSSREKTISRDPTSTLLREGLMGGESEYVQKVPLEVMPVLPRCKNFLWFNTTMLRVNRGSNVTEEGR